LYKRIAGARDDFALRELQVEMIDRFGLLPQQVKNLFAIAALKLRATPMGIRKLELGPNGGRVIFRDKPDVEPMTILRLIQRQPHVYKLEGQDKLRVTMELPGATERLRAAEQLLEALAVKARAA
jgi:transcription-repair coupling factor (superfamily II helicase)